ncbi:hypothetical protein MC885_016166, partial [Smutsia gigantea]
ELPPPYTAIASPDASGIPVINCRVCQSLINLDGKLHQHVVKCTVCNEATNNQLNLHCQSNQKVRGSCVGTVETRFWLAPKILQGDFMQPMFLGQLLIS